MVTPSVEAGPETFQPLATAQNIKISFHYTELFEESKYPTFAEISKKWNLQPSIFKYIEQTLQSRAACASNQDNFGAEINRNISDHYWHFISRFSC